MTDYDWQTEQFKDECERIRAYIEALEIAAQHGTPCEVVQLLADEHGVGEFYRRHHEPQ